MSKKPFQMELGERRDFWNVPCNPILGYRLPYIKTLPLRKTVVKAEFFDAPEPLKSFS